MNKVNKALEALKLAEAALADIGDAEREPGDDLAWCEARAAKPLPVVRAAIAAAQGAGPSGDYRRGVESAAAVARHYAEMDYAAMGYPEEGGIAASGTAHEIERQILALTPPGDAPTPEDAP